VTDSKQIDVSYDVTDQRVAVSTGHLGAVCTAVVERSGDVEPARHVPIGTRSAEHLTMTVDGRPADLRPGPGGLTRGSYQVTAVLDGVTYLLKPSSSTESRLTRDGARIGEFSRKSPTEVLAWWEAGAEITPVDAAIGYALSAAFGTGKKFFLLALVEDGSGSVAG
jgi:hypothetical protein